MLSNFGLMEFLFLALLALVFFGPERLPQIGATIGRWLRQLTQYSKAFMNQWSEEALVIQDAVAEVRGIRDEILAAQAEISSSLNTARTDINQTIDEARGTIRAAQPDPNAFLEGRTGPALAAATASAGAARPADQQIVSEGSDAAAIARTQQVVDDLLAKRAAAQAVPGNGEIEEIPAESLVSEVVEPAPSLLVEPATAAPDKVDLAALEKNKEKRQAESAFDRTQRVLDRLMGKEVAPAEEVAEPMPEPEGTEVAPAQAVSSPVTGTADQPDLAAPASAETVEQPAPETKKPKESAFDRTQRVLDRLMGKETVPEEETPVPEVAPAAPAVQPESQVETAPVAAPSGTERIVPAVDLRRVASTTSGYGDYTKLSLEVSMLRDELRSLRQELLVLRSAVKEYSIAESKAETLGSVEEAA